MKWLLLAVGLVLGAVPVLAQEDPLERARRADATARLLRVPISGPLTTETVNRALEGMRTALAEAPEIGWVVLELETQGGELEAAQRLADYVLRDLKGVPTVTFIPPDRQVLAEGLLVAFSAKSLVLGKDARIGADLSRRADPARDTALRDQLRRVGRERGYPQVLLDAMATADHEDVWRQRVAAGRGRDEEEDRFLTRADLDALAPANRRGEPVKLVPRGTRLVLSADEAYSTYHLTRIGANTIAELKVALQITVPEENEVFVGARPARPLAPGAQGLVEFLNHPLTRWALILTGCLAALIEVKTMGTFIAGLISLLCFTIFFVAASLPTSLHPVPTALPWEIALFLGGLVFIALEAFLTPGLAVFGLVGCAACAVSVVLAMVPSEASQLGPDQTMGDAIESAVTVLAFGFAAGCVLFFGLLHFLSRRGAAARAGLVTTTTLSGTATSETPLEAQAALAQVIGKEGSAATTLRPAGKVELDEGRLLDVVAEGELVERGTRVKVVGAEGGIFRVVPVGPAPPPPPRSAEPGPEDTLSRL